MMDNLPSDIIFNFDDSNPIDIIRKYSLLGRLEKKICNDLGFSEQQDDEIYFPKKVDLSNYVDVDTGVLVFSKEKISSSNVGMDKIKDSIINFYSNDGFQVNFEKIHPLEFVNFSPIYFFKVSKNLSKYLITLLDGEDYSLIISKYSEKNEIPGNKTIY